MKRTPLLQYHDRVIARVKDLYSQEHGTDIGARTWFADQLGVTRQCLDKWQVRNGIPRKYVARVAEITGMKKEEIRPDTILLELPKKTWSAICREASKDLTDQATIHVLRMRQ